MWIEFDEFVEFKSYNLLYIIHNEQSTSHGNVPTIAKKNKLLLACNDYTNLDTHTIDKIFTSENMTMLKYYTDWSCLLQTWKWWQAFVRSDWFEKSSQNYGATTNNAMELQAIYEACKDIHENHWHWCQVIIVTDSMRCLNIITWAWKLQKREYKNIIAQIQRILEFYNVQIEWVRWHNWDEMNERADKLAKSQVFSCK